MNERPAFMYALEVLDLRKTYSSFRGSRKEALRGVSFQVEEGSVTGLLGPNGAGKTTTLKILTGLIRPDGGEVRVLGRKWGVELLPLIGFLPEQPYFEHHMNPRDLLSYYGKLMGIGKHSLAGKVEYLLNLVGLEDVMDLPLGKFSKGMLQRVGLAQALLNDPRLLILDEPASGLDPLGRVQVKNLIRDFKKRGVAVLLSSHQLSEVEETCDRVVMLYRGKEVAAGTLDELLSKGDEVDLVCRERIPEAVWEKLESLVLVTHPDRRRIAVRRDRLREVLRLLLEGGVEVDEIIPRRLSLEEFFLSRVGEVGDE